MNKICKYNLKFSFIELEHCLHGVMRLSWWTWPSSLYIYLSSARVCLWRSNAVKFNSYFSINHFSLLLTTDPKQKQGAVNRRRRFPKRGRNLRGVWMKALCPHCVWSRFTPNTANSSTTSGCWSGSPLCSFDSWESRATCAWAPLPFACLSGTD